MDAVIEVLIFLGGSFIAEGFVSALLPGLARSDSRPVVGPDPPRNFGYHVLPDPARGRTGVVFFAAGSAGLDDDAAALLRHAVDVYGAQPIDWLTIEASYDRREVADAAQGRALARARIKAVQDALENAGLSLTYLSRVREYGIGARSDEGRAALRRIRLELPLRAA